MLVNSRYTILDKLGNGGMGEVYLARDIPLDRTVALKILQSERCADAKMVRRFKQEAKAASALNHPCIPTIHEVGETADGRPYIAMERVEGQDLSQLLKGGPLSISQVIHIGSQIADGMDEAHSKGIVHRDIKPANIMVTRKGQVKVLDFGLAKVNQIDPNRELDTQVVTSPGSLTGTVRFMSPEQALGRPIDHRSDIFSLGIVLYEMTVGCSPFSGSNSLETIDHIIHSKPKTMSDERGDVPAKLEKIVNRCLEKSPDQRYGSAKDLACDLRQVRVQTRPSPRRHIVFSFVLALSILLLLVSPIHNMVRAALGVSAVTQQERMAILPLVNIGGNAEQQSFGEALIETMSSKLSQDGRFNEVFCVVPASDMRDRKVSSVSHAFREFGATLVVTGSMQWQADNVRVTLNLVDARTLRQLRSSVDDHSAILGAALQDCIVLKLEQVISSKLPSALRESRLDGLSNDSPFVCCSYLPRVERCHQPAPTLMRSSFFPQKQKSGKRSKLFPPHLDRCVPRARACSEARRYWTG
jgi:TolB-like protein/predicted Ser/Thr protein kinase